MDKKEFLSTLEKKLSILNKNERDDIINEYKNTINEKVKNGQDEKDAIKDFGDIDELARELLDAYKIDPDFDKESSLLEDTEGLIKKGANKLADFTKNAYNRFKATNTDINLSLVFEILIKIFLLVLVLAVLRLPFILFEDLGNEIFDAIFSPVDDILSFIWQIFLMILYVVFCILIGIALFKKYFENAPVVEVKENKPVKQVKKEKTNHTTFGDVCLLIVKIWVILCVIVPLACLDAFALFGLIVSVIYLFKGINLYGLCILLTGCIILGTYLMKVLFNLIFIKKKVVFYPAIIGIILSVAGAVMFTDMLMNIDYKKVSDIPKNDLKEEVYTLDKNLIIGDHYYTNYTKKEDNTMEDNVIKISAHYNKEYYDLNINFHNEYSEDDNLYDYISIDLNGNDNFKKEYNRFLENLKNNKIYTYDEEVDVIITGNSNTLNKIKYE